MHSKKHFASLGLLAATLTACGGSYVDTATAPAASVRMGSPIPSAVSPTQAHAALLQNIYLAYFGRVPDKSGLAYWTAVFDSQNMPLSTDDFLAAYRSDSKVKGLLDVFGDSAEFKEQYTGTNAEFINTVYINLFGRYAETAGRAYWTSLLDNGAITRTYAAMAILVGAQGDDQLVVAKKIEVASRYMAAVTALNLPDASGFTSPQFDIAGRDLLALVSKNTDLITFQAQIDAAAQSLPSFRAATYLIRYSGFQDSYPDIGNPVQYRLSYGSAYVAVASGKLIFGTGERTIAFADSMNPLGRLVYDAPVTATVAVAADADGTRPTMLMLCQASTSQASVPNKSTDILVINSAQMLLSAKDLAGQTLTTYRENCGTQSDTRIVFDADGNATMTSAAGITSYTAKTITGMLNGQTDMLNQEKIISWRGYRYLNKANGNYKYAIVSRITPNPAVIQTVPNVPVVGALSLWSQE